MGRSPCCDKVGLKRGTWTPEEDQKLLAFIEEHGHGSWRTLPEKSGLQRCGKSCRLRWKNYLRPDIKRGKFTSQEDQTIIQLHALLGNRWSVIATHLPMRTDNEIKNQWNTRLKKRLTKMGIDPMTHKPHNHAQFKGDANLSHMAQWESARLGAEARLARKSSKIISVDVPHYSQLQNQAKALWPFAPPCRPPLCLDVLKVWQGGWEKRKQEDATVVNTCSNFPNANLNFSENIFTVPSVGFGEEHSFITSINCIQNLGPFQVGTSSKEENIQNDNFTGMNNSTTYIRVPSLMEEGFTDLVADSDNVTGSSSCGRDFEENKEYWNDLLMSVNSPMDSTVFVNHTKVVEG